MAGPGDEENQGDDSTPGGSGGLDGATPGGVLTEGGELGDGTLGGTLEGSFSLENLLAGDVRTAQVSNLRRTRSGQYQMDLNRPGGFAEGIEAIEQSIYVILNTVPGSQPFRPNFGSDIWNKLDMPLSVAGPLLAADIERNLNEYEPRITVDRVEYQLINSYGTVSGALSGVRFNIYWTGTGDLSTEQVSDIVSVARGNDSVAPGIYFILATDEGQFIQTDEGRNIPI